MLPPMMRVAGKLEDRDILEKKTGKVLGRTRAGQPGWFGRLATPPAFIQLDDLTETKLDTVRPVAFLTVRTSPGNQQAWIAVPGFSRAIRSARTLSVAWKRTGNHRMFSASGSVRLAGTSNFKPKYIGNFPKVAVIDTAPGQHNNAGSARSPWPCCSSSSLTSPPPWFLLRPPANAATWGKEPEMAGLSTLSA